MTRIGRRGGLFEIETATGDRVRCRRVINAAGLGATGLAAATDGLSSAHVPRLWYGAGHYYQLHRGVPFSRLIYPLPGPGALGVHLGFDLAGRARFGPDLRYTERADYDFDDSRRHQFAEAIRIESPGLTASLALGEFVADVFGDDQQLGI